MKHTHTLATALLLCCVAVSSQATAGDVALHGFIRSAYEISNSEAPYLESVDDRGGFADSAAGVVFAASLNAQWSVAGQFHFKAVEGELNMDWAFATLQLTETTSVRFGRQKYPLGLVSENIDIGITYPWARPPSEFYRLEMGDESPNLFVESFDGLSVVYSGGDDWEFSLQPFTGQIGYSEGADNYQRQMVGLKLEVTNDMITLQAGGLSSKLTIAGDLDNQTKVTYNLGAKLEIDDFLAYAEYADSTVDSNALFESNAGYLTLGYQFSTLLPSITFASVEGHGGNLDQTSTALALSYHYNASTVFKTQWKRIEPDDPTTDGLIEALPAGDDNVDIVSFTMDLVF
ncbi:MAG: porin [Ectothiorhodospiraceae bacterium]|nr:porin [Ectothiorhodospiraceae bacterium]